MLPLMITPSNLAPQTAKPQTTPHASHLTPTPFPLPPSSYGQMQSWTPQLVLGPLRQAPPTKWVAALWSGILTVVPLTLGIVMLAGGALCGKAGGLSAEPGDGNGDILPTSCSGRGLQHAAPLASPSSPHRHKAHAAQPPPPPSADTFGVGVSRGPAVAAITVVLCELPAQAVQCR